jgi:hypothetical protein
MKERKRKKKQNPKLGYDRVLKTRHTPELKNLHREEEKRDDAKRHRKPQC